MRLLTTKRFEKDLNAFFRSPVRQEFCATRAVGKVARQSPRESIPKNAGLVAESSLNRRASEWIGTALDPLLHCATAAEQTGRGLDRTLSGAALFARYAGWKLSLERR